MFFSLSNFLTATTSATNKPIATTVTIASSINRNGKNQDNIISNFAIFLSTFGNNFYYVNAYCGKLSN